MIKEGFWSNRPILSFRMFCLVSIIFSFLFTLSDPAFANSGIYQKTFENDKKQLKRARKLIRKEELNRAENILRGLLRRQPELSDAKLHLARVLLKQKKVTDAYNLAYDVALAEPDNALAFAILGNALTGIGNFRDAEISYRNALILDKKEAFAWAGYGMLDFHENRLKDSIRKLQTANYYKSNEPDFVFLLAKVSARAENYNEAADAYRKFLRIAGKKDKERRERIKGLIRFLEFLGNRQSLYDVGGEKQTIIPMKLKGNRPLIQVRINRKDKPLNFVLDTGSGMSVISEKTAKRLGIRSVARGGQARAVGGDGKFDIVYGFLKTVDIGDVQVRSVPVYIRKFHNPKQTVDGYIGISLLSNFLTTIDYGNLQFSLVRKDDESIDVADETPLPLRITTSGFLSGLVKLDGIEDPLNFIVDTGASVSVISKEVANLEEIKKFKREETMRVIGAAGITEGVSAFTLPKVSFGRYSNDKITAIALNLNIINETTGFEQAGILGGNFLKNYRVTFDFKNSKILFVPINK